MGQGYYGILTREMIDDAFAYDINQIRQQLMPTPTPITQESLHGVLDSGVEVFVAILNDQVIATALYWAVDLLYGRHGYIADVAVDVNFFGQGIGQGLLQHVIALSQEQGVLDLTVVTGPTQGDEVAAAYRALGFIELPDERVFRLH